MAIKTIPLSHLETNLKATLTESADSVQAIVVELPDRRLVAIQVLDAANGDSLTDDLLQSNPAFQALIAKSKASPRKPFMSASSNFSKSLGPIRSDTSPTRERGTNILDIVSLARASGWYRTQVY